MHPPLLLVALVPLLHDREKKLARPPTRWYHSLLLSRLLRTGAVVLGIQQTAAAWSFSVASYIHTTHIYVLCSMFLSTSLSRPYSLLFSSLDISQWGILFSKKVKILVARSGVFFGVISDLWSFFGAGWSQVKIQKHFAVSKSWESLLHVIFFLKIYHAKQVLSLERND